MKTNLEIIRNTVTKANEEIMELKLGCRVRTIRGTYGTYICKIREKTKGPYGDNAATHYVQVDNEKGPSCEYDHHIKSLGRPIHLSDVLYVMEFYIGGSFKKRGNWLKILSIWNLLDDNLEDQSEETLQFLADLLTPSQK